MNEMTIKHNDGTETKVTPIKMWTPCDHVFDGKVWYSDDGRTGSVTCSKCGLPEIYYDLRRLP